MDDDLEDLYTDGEGVSDQEGESIRSDETYDLYHPDADTSSNHNSETEDQPPQYTVAAECRTIPCFAPSMLPRSDDRRVKYFEVRCDDDYSCARGGSRLFRRRLLVLEHEF